MENKESSVDLLATYIKGISSLNCDEIIQQAKAMHKQEIIDAYWVGGQDVPMHINTCKRYYNETYNNENTDTTT